MRKKVSVAVVLTVVVLAAVFALRQTADASDNAAEQSEVIEDKDSYVPAEKISDDADTVDHKFTPNIP